MAKLLLLNKPYGVLSQFSDAQSSNQERRPTLADFIDIRDVYPAGRLDFDSEGLLLLTDDGRLQHQISHPQHKMKKTYWAQVEGKIDKAAILKLQQGIELQDGPTQPAQAKAIAEPDIWARTPPIRSRANVPTSWLELTISEGRNRQVRRMTAAVGFPTLRLIRTAIGPWHITDIAPGEFKQLELHMPQQQKAANKKTSNRRTGNNSKHHVKRTTRRGPKP